MASVLYRAVFTSREVASWAIVTDPKDDMARDFYASFGFRELTETRQFLTIAAAAKWLNTP